MAHQGGLVCYHIACYLAGLPTLKPQTSLLSAIVNPQHLPNSYEETLTPAAHHYCYDLS